MVDVHGRVIVWVWPAMSRYSRGSFFGAKIVAAAVAVVVGLITEVDQVPNIIGILIK